MRRTASAEEDETTPDPNVEPREKRTSGYDIGQLQGGFRVAGTGARTFPESVRVEIAYATDTGALSYSPFDFDLARAPISIVAERATYRAGANLLDIAPEQNDFSVTVLGFDANRDLDVRTRA